MRGQECDRPKALAIELSKIGACVVASYDYDTLYVWPLNTHVAEIVAWHRDNNAGDTVIFHQDGQIFKAALPE